MTAELANRAGSDVDYSFLLKYSCQSLFRKWLEVMALWHVTDNSRKAFSGKEYKEDVGAPMVILPFALGASNACH